MIAIPDEVSYLHALNSADSLVKGNITGFWTNVFQVHGRDAAAIIWQIPALFTRVFFSSVPSENQQLLLIPQAFHFIFSILTLVLFYRLAKILFPKNKRLVLLGICVYGLLTNNNVYLRHLLPYDISLTFFLFSLIIAVSTLPIFYRVIFSAQTSCFAATIYPGYYPFFIIILAMVIYSLSGEPIKLSTLITLCFIGIFLSPIIFLSIVESKYGHSYLAEILKLSESVIQGSPSEVLTFVLKYLVFVESYGGISLLFGFILFILTVASKVIQYKKLSKVEIVCASSLVSYLLYTLFAVKSHSVLYGRLLHMYFPFLVLTNLAAIQNLPTAGWKKLASGVLFISVLLSFLSFYPVYLRLEYPRDVLYRLGVNTASLKDTDFVFESPVLRKVDSPPPWDEKNKRSNPNRRFILVNFGWFFHFSGQYSPYTPPLKANILFTAPHYLTFMPYLYEGYSIEERDFLMSHKYTMRIYKATSSP